VDGEHDLVSHRSAEQEVLARQTSLALAAGAVPANLVGVYRALGGGWQSREDQAFVPPQTIDAMTGRTDLGRLLDYEIKVPPIPVPRPELPRLPEW
jgi:hypothetical protein